MSAAGGFDWRSNPEHHAAQSMLSHMTAYYAWTLALFGRDFQGPAADAGAGSGHFSELLSSRVKPLVLLEGGQENLDLLRQRFAERPDVTVEDCDLTRCGGTLAHHGIRSIFTLDVLEHLPDDLAVLKQFHDALAPGGRLYIKVPALQFLYGPVDEASGHYRRYSRSRLRKVVEAAGFTVEKCHYMNIAGVAPYFLKSRILKRRENFSRTFTVSQIQRIQRAMPYLRILDRVTGPFIGLSVICVAHRQ